MNTLSPTVPFCKTIDTYIELEGKLTNNSNLADYLQVHKKRWSQSFAFVPEGNETMTAVELGSYCVVLPILKDVFGYGNLIGTDFEPGEPPRAFQKQFATQDGTHEFHFENFNLEFDRYPFENESVDLMICWEVIEHMTVDPMFMISEINRSLKVGGKLIITTPNIASAVGVEKILQGYNPQLYTDFLRTGSSNRHNYEYSPHVLNAVLLKSGFQVDTLTTLDSWAEQPPRIIGLLDKHGYDKNLRGDNLLVVATKISDTIERYPHEIYGPGNAERKSSKAND